MLECGTVHGGGFRILESLLCPCADCPPPFPWEQPCLAGRAKQSWIPCSSPAVEGCWEMAFQDRALSLFCFAGNCAEYVITFQEFSFYLPKYHLLPWVKWRLWGDESVDLLLWKSFTCWSGEELSPTYVDCVPLEGRVFLQLLSVFSRNEVVLKTQNNLVFFQFVRMSFFVLNVLPLAATPIQLHREISTFWARWNCPKTYLDGFVPVNTSVFSDHMAVATKTQNRLFLEFFINSLKTIFSW